MNKLVKALVGSAFLLCSSLQAAFAGNGSGMWVNASNGNIPYNAVVSGSEPGRPKMYVCRVAYKGGIHPGKLLPDLGGCYIGYGGKEYGFANYQVLTMSEDDFKWMFNFDGEIYEGTVIGGSEPGRDELYICRANFKGGIHSGKLLTDKKACHFSWGGLEYLATDYEVLVDLSYM